MKATLSNYTQPPRKVRLVTDLIKGKSVPEALTLLKFEIKRAGNPIAKLVASAAANAEKQGERLDELVIQNITVNKGVVTTRYMPRAFGTPAPIRKRRSHVTVTLGKRVTAPKRKRK